MLFKQVLVPILLTVSTPAETLLRSRLAFKAETFQLARLNRATWLAVCRRACLAVSNLKNTYMRLHCRLPGQNKANGRLLRRSFSKQWYRHSS